MANTRTADFPFKTFADGREPAVTVYWAEQTFPSARPIGELLWAATASEPYKN
jgi:hypothetical protein